MSETTMPQQHQTATAATAAPSSPLMIGVRSESYSIDPAPVDLDNSTSAVAQSAQSASATEAQKQKMRNIFIGIVLTIMAVTIIVVLCFVFLNNQKTGDGSDEPPDTETSFDVTQYGAIGDGIHDDAPAVAACIRAAVSAIYSSGVWAIQIRFPSGIYLLNSSAPDGFIQFSSSIQTFSVVGDWGLGMSTILWNSALGPLFNFPPINAAASIYVGRLKIKMINTQQQYPLAHINQYTWMMFYTIEIKTAAGAFSDLVNGMAVTEAPSTTLFDVPSVQYISFEDTRVENMTKTTFLSSSASAKSINLQNVTLINVKEGIRLDTIDASTQMTVNIQQSTFLNVDTAIHATGAGYVKVQVSSSTFQRNSASLTNANSTQILFEPTLQYSSTLTLSQCHLSDLTPSSIFVDQHTSLIVYKSTFLGGRIALMSSTPPSKYSPQLNITHSVFTNQSQHSIVGEGWNILIDSNICQGSNASMLVQCNLLPCQASGNSKECGIQL